jgi:hypothetical protein
MRSYPGILHGDMIKSCPSNQRPMGAEGKVLFLSLFFHVNPGLWVLRVFLVVIIL